MIKRKKTKTEYSSLAFNIYKVCLMSVMGFCVIAASFAYKTYAKYAFNDKSETTINANEFYFTSNYLDSYTTSTSADSSDVTYENVAEYIMSGWDGFTSRTFQFNIRNYDNVLLYNNEEQNIYYEIGYEIDSTYADKINISLERIDSDAAPGIVVEDTNETDEQGNYKKHTLYKLEGGADTYTTHNYRLVVSVKAGVKIENDITVRLIAHTVESDTSFYEEYQSPYYAKLMCDVTLQYSQYNNFIAYQGFLKAPNSSIEDYDNGKYTDTTEYNINRVALLYELYTSNKIEYENTDVHIATQTIELTWNNELVELNEYDKKIIKPIDIKRWEDIKKSEDDKMINYKNIVIIETLDNGDEVGHLFFDALAYSAYEIVFHKRTYNTNDLSIWETDAGQYKWNMTYDNLKEILAQGKNPLENGFIVYARTIDNN